MMGNTMSTGHAGRLVAMVASYTACRRLVGAAALAMGGGIWSMHFVAVLAYSMPGVPTSCDPVITALSFGLAVGFLGIPIPLFLLPRIQTEEWVDEQDRHLFNV